MYHITNKFLEAVAIIHIHILECYISDLLVCRKCEGKRVPCLNYKLVAVKTLNTILIIETRG